MLPGLTCAVGETGLVELAHVELEADDREHKDGEEEKQPNLQEWNHGLHDGLEHHLQTWARAATAGQVRAEWAVQELGWGCGQTSQSLGWAALGVPGQGTELGALKVGNGAGSMGKHESWGNSMRLQESPQGRGPNISLGGKWTEQCPKAEEKQGVGCQSMKSGERCGPMEGSGWHSESRES